MSVDNRAVINREVLTVRVKGDSACFARPEFPLERVSYPIITPTAAVGLLESVFWKPQIRWIPLRVEMFTEPRFQNIRINGVKDKTGKQKKGRGSTEYVPFENTQINFRVLGPVEYVISYGIAVVEADAHPWNAYLEQAERRLRKGQFFRAPFLGAREHLADVELVDRSVARRPIDLTFPIGPMVHSIAYEQRGMRPSLFDAHVVSGVMEIPADPDWSEQ